jgi:hypothetical protein
MKVLGNIPFMEKSPMSALKSATRTPDDPSNAFERQSRASKAQVEARKKLEACFSNTPLPLDQLMVNLPLYLRSSALAKILYINELYELIVNVPGVVVEFGAWWGTNMVLFENLRAVYEPYNYTRRVIGFDTFEGYDNLNLKDGKDELLKQGHYSVSKNYLDHLAQVLDYHQSENVMSHINRYELIKGDVTKTAGAYFNDNPETIVSLAYFDMQLYAPTKAGLEAIGPYLTKGSVIAMDELNCREFPGETTAFKEVFPLNQVRLVRSRYLPDRCFVIIE